MKSAYVFVRKDSTIPTEVGIQQSILWITAFPGMGNSYQVYRIPKLFCSVLEYLQHSVSNSLKLYFL